MLLIHITTLIMPGGIAFFPGRRSLPMHAAGNSWLQGVSNRSLKHANKTPHSARLKLSSPSLHLKRVTSYFGSERRLCPCFHYLAHVPIILVFWWKKTECCLLVSLLWHYPILWRGISMILLPH